MNYNKRRVMRRTEVMLERNRSKKLEIKGKPLNSFV